jgi:predicted GNAT family acetyltransferase
VDPETDRPALAISVAAQRVAEASPDAWVQRRHGILAFHSSVATAMANAVIVFGRDARPSDAEQLLTELRTRRVPHRLQVRLPADASLVRRVEGMGMRRSQDIPLMVVIDPSGPRYEPPDDVEIRMLSGDEVTTHATIAASGSAVPAELFSAVWNTAAMSLDGLRCYVAEVDGRPVGTSIGMLVGEAVVVLNVVTLNAYTRRGIGGALTTRAVRDGLAAGASWACLQSTPAGYALYSRLGFREREVWGEWVSD